MHEVLGVIYLFAALLGGSVVSGICMKYDWLPAFKHPLDGGRTFRGKPLFGPNKTWRGVLAMGLGTALFFALQADLLHAIPGCRSLELFDYSSVPGWLLGFALGVCAMLAELPNSFVKRQLNISPGQAGRGPLAVFCYFFDQVDLLLGAWLVLMWVLPVTFERILLSITIVIIAHQIVTLLAYSLGMRATLR